MSPVRLFRLLGLAGVGFFLASAFTPLPNLLGRWLVTPPELGPAEAIVVLGSSVWPDGTLSSSSLRRTLHGITLHRRGLAPLLVLVGPAQGEGPVEAERRAELARELGVSPEAILTEARARTTREEAVGVRALLRPRGVSRILLVTDSSHMRRARRLFEHAGFEVRAAPADDWSNDADLPEDRLGLTRRILAELLAQLYYRLAGYL